MYHIENLPARPKRPPISRSNTSSAQLPSLARAIVRKRADESPLSEGRFNFRSNTPEVTSSRASSVIDIERPEVNSQRNGSTGNVNQYCKNLAQIEDEEDGSMILVRKAEYVIKAKLPTPQSAKAEIKGPNGNDEDGDADRDDVHQRLSKEVEKRGKGEKYKQHRRYLDSSLTGLMGAMKLESQLLLLKRELQLYEVFDNASSGKLPVLQYSLDKTKRSTLA